MKSRIEIKRICAWCGKEFIAYKTTTNCCSHKCGNALYKKRKRDAAIIANNNLTEKIVTEKPIEKIKDKPFLTITETAIYLGVTRPTIYGYLKRGDLKATRIGTKFLHRQVKLIIYTQLSPKQNDERFSFIDSLGCSVLLSPISKQRLSII